MAGLPFRFSELAERHLDRLRGYHHELGGQFHVEELDREIVLLLEHIREFPGAYSFWRNPIRRIVNPRFFLALYYQVAPDSIEILAITDQRQDPRRLRFLAPPR